VPTNTGSPFFEVDRQVQGEMLLSYRDGDKTQQLSPGYLEFLPNPHLIEVIASDAEVRRELA